MLKRSKKITSSDSPFSQASKIVVRGARQHNLKNITVELPKNQLIVLTGLSGSGKSSFAFDTLYAEGQRRYVESLSSYARQFLGVMSKPDVDSIEGLSPAISIDQKTVSHNPRSTVGTITEIYDYLRLLYARVGRAHCPSCGALVMRQSIDQIMRHLLESISTELRSKKQSRLMILAPVIRGTKGEFTALFSNLRKQGYQRVRIDGVVFRLDEDFLMLQNNKHTIEVIVDRFVFSKESFALLAPGQEEYSRLVSSVELSLKLADGLVLGSFIDDAEFSLPEKPKQMRDVLFSEKFMCAKCGTALPELEPRMFSFNTPHGACPSCNGLGTILKIDQEKLIAPTLTIAEGAIVPFANMFVHETWYGRLVKEVLKTYEVSTQIAWEDLDENLRKMLLFGDRKTYEVVGENRFGKQTTIHETWLGFIPELERRYSSSESDYVRTEIERFMKKEQCTLCDGKRLKKESLGVTIKNLSIIDLTDLSIRDAVDWVTDLASVEQSDFSLKEQKIAEPIIKEILTRLRFLFSVGLDYLTLGREASTLAGGEAQRIRLASQIGTGLAGVLYVLDEPTIGLHQRDNRRLIQTLERLRDAGNTVVVVEHDRETILSADWVIEFGPKAGIHGGEIVALGTPDVLRLTPSSLTGKYLSGKKDVRLPTDRVRVEHNDRLMIRGARKHNLKSLDVDIPLGKFICITGVSGSGKSTLMYDIIHANLLKYLGRAVDDTPGEISEMVVPDELRRIVMIDQSPIGRTPRSNPATYTKLFDTVRSVFSQTQEAVSRGYGPGRFSFNVKGGRCEACQGEGQIKIEMQFLPDMYVECDVCHGTRYNTETLQVTYRDKTIAEVLNMTVEEAVGFFSSVTSIRTKLQTLDDVGLGYIHLGQPAPTLSGGEAQRVKLARELSTRSTEHTLYLLDEPTTGLHFQDIQHLLEVLNRLVSADNTVIVIEHNLDVIKNADWILDLGPEGGDAGGEIVGVGTVEQLMANPNSLTGQFLSQESK